MFLTFKLGQVISLNHRPDPDKPRFGRRDCRLSDCFLYHYTLTDSLTIDSGTSREWSIKDV